MKKILGFGREEAQETEARAEAAAAREDRPVPSVVKVTFPEDGRTLAYYNDRFDLREGDMVFVSGKLAGVRGFVVSVTRRFKIRLSDYERVVARPEVRLSGSWTPVRDTMLSFDRGAVPPEVFRSWIKPPADGDDGDYVLGEGYTVTLEPFDCDEDVDPAVMKRGADYASDGRVHYLSLRDGVGTAFVEGTRWYEVNFRYGDGAVSDLFCECPYAGLCKHCLAVLLTLRGLLENAEQESFTAMSRSWFFRTLAVAEQTVTVQD